MSLRRWPHGSCRVVSAFHGRNGPGWWPGWFPQLVDAKARSLTFGVINEHRERIGTMLASNTVTTVHQRLRDEHGLAASIAAFRRYVPLEFPDLVEVAQVTVPRPLIDPGSEAQIDYGFLGPWVDPVTQRARRVWAFVIVLACWRHMFVRPVSVWTSTPGSKRMSPRSSSSGRSRPGWCRTT